MKRALLAPLRHTPLDVGNKIAWWLFLVVFGFGAGWAAAVAYWSNWCFPIV